MSNTAIKKDLAHTEHEALKFFLDSVKKKLNNKFSTFSASVSNSGEIPQLQIRERKGKMKKYRK